MEAIRIGFAERPKMLRDILYASLATEPGVAVLGESTGVRELRRLVEPGGVDTALIGLSDSDIPAAHYQLFDVDARIRILAIGDHGRNAPFYQLRRYRKMLGEGSPQQVIRERMRSPWEWGGARVSPGD